jgi:hypothetical protein
MPLCHGRRRIVDEKLYAVAALPIVGAQMAGDMERVARRQQGLAQRFPGPAKRDRKSVV